MTNTDGAAQARQSEVIDKAQRARIASRALAKLDTTVRNRALDALADALLTQQDYLLEHNALDVAAARQMGTQESLIDRLELSPARIEDIAQALRTLARQNDPIGTVTEGRTLYNGLRLRRVRVPLGVVAMIYEARPNVTADAAGLTLKTANACLLRGGSLANNSNISMTKVLYEAGIAKGLPADWLQSIETTDRAATTELMQLHGLIDVLIPRGSATLIRSCVENSKVPVIETGAGNCHIYIHTDARSNIVVPIIINAKTQRPGVCNAAESLLVDAAAAEKFVPPVLEALTSAGVLVHADPTILALAQSLDAARQKLVVAATEADWGTEYQELELSFKCVAGIDAAIEHINTYSTHHSEAILSEDYTAVNRFLQEVDSAAVYANASTRFTDGGEFGLGAEIGISTQKLHARGPMGLDALTSTKFLLEGEGQIR
ncbi:MAG: glutamate-5-semialdehyde dehydrogenase [Coriobacteriales bacterium]|jgi:glutamate-5-semialdehyde dehydrogenase|nr:glutamate-5-semialdehyde dehydrogenase [Coriobacteriales bacterium]